MGENPPFSDFHPYEKNVSMCVVSLSSGYGGPDLGSDRRWKCSLSYPSMPPPVMRLLWESLTRITCLGLRIPIDPHFHTCILVFILMSNPNTFCSYFRRLLRPAFQVSALWTKWSWWITLCPSWVSEWKCWTFFPQEVCDTVDGRDPAPVDVVYLTVYEVLPLSQVFVWDFFHQQYCHGMIFPSKIGPFL